MKKSILMWMFLFTVVVGFTSCSDDDDSKANYSFSPSEMVLEYNSESKIEVLPSDEGFEFSSDNNAIASTDIVGKVSANRSGETYINIINTNANFVGKCKVTITPTYTMYREPCLNFGCSRSEVEAYEKREFASESGSSIGYKGENDDILLVMYTFVDGQLSAVTMLYPYTSHVQEYLYEHLKQRFITEVTKDGTALMSPDKKIGGMLTRYRPGNVNYSQVMLFPYK